MMDLPTRIYCRCVNRGGNLIDQTSIYTDTNRFAPLFCLSLCPSSPCRVSFFVFLPFVSPFPFPFPFTLSLPQPRLCDPSRRFSTCPPPPPSSTACPWSSPPRLPLRTSRRPASSRRSVSGEKGRGGASRLRSAHCRRSASLLLCREGRAGAQPQLVWSVRNNDGHGAASTAPCACDSQCAHSPRPFAAAALLRRPLLLPAAAN